MASGVKISTNQLQYDFYWQVGPRLRMNLKFFPAYVDNSSSHTFNRSELLRLTSMFTGWLIPDSDLFGPYELMGFNLLGPYQDGKSQKLLCIFFSWMNTGQNIIERKTALTGNIYLLICINGIQD